MPYPEEAQLGQIFGSALPWSKGGEGEKTSDRTALGYCIVFLAVTTLIGGVAARKKRKTGNDYLLIIISHE